MYIKSGAERATACTDHPSTTCTDKNVLINMFRCILVEIF